MIVKRSYQIAGLITFIVFFKSPPGYSAENRPSLSRPAKAESKPASPKKPKSSWSNTPEWQNTGLAEKKHEMAVIFASSYLGIGQGLEYKKVLATDLDWGIQLIRTQATLKGKASGAVKESLESRNIHFGGFLRIKPQPYVHLSSGLMTSNMRGTYSWLNSNEPISGQFTASLLSFNMSAGSDWIILPNFSIGCEWIGFSYPLYTRTSIKGSEDLNQTTFVLSNATPEDRVTSEARSQINLYFGLLKMSYLF